MITFHLLDLQHATGARRACENPDLNHRANVHRLATDSELCTRNSVSPHSTHRQHQQSLIILCFSLTEMGNLFQESPILQVYLSLLGSTLTYL